MRYLISCMALSLLATACTLDYTPTNSITYSNAFSRESELNATTVSIHFYLNNCLESSSILTQVGLIADETASSDELREWNPRTVIGGNYDWKPLYNLIFEANLLLENIGRTQGLTDERRAYHVGQAQFALGFAYFTLSRAFGLAVIPESTSAIRQYPLSSMLQVIDKAIYHAEQAYSILPTYDKLRNLSGAAVSSKQFASKGNSAALLAHLYAWKGSMIELYGLSGASAQEAYRKSVDYASVLINGQAGSYSLLSSPEELCKRLRRTTPRRSSASSTTRPVATTPSRTMRSQPSTAPGLSIRPYRKGISPMPPSVCSPLPYAASTQMQATRDARPSSTRPTRRTRWRARTMRSPTSSATPSSSTTPAAPRG